jgi:hypothetical protein
MRAHARRRGHALLHRPAPRAVCRILTSAPPPSRPPTPAYPSFRPRGRRVVAAIPRERQTLLFTATWPQEIRRLASEFQNSPVQITIGAGGDRPTANKDITQVRADGGGRLRGTGCAQLEAGRVWRTAGARSRSALGARARAAALSRQTPLSAALTSPPPSRPHLVPSPPLRTVSPRSPRPPSLTFPSLPAPSLLAPPSVARAPAARRDHTDPLRQGAAADGDADRARRAGRARAHLLLDEAHVRRPLLRAAPPDPVQCDPR